MIAWLVDAAAIITQKALLKCSYAPYARVMKKICWEESFHILHGRDVDPRAGDGHAGAARARAGGARPLVGAADALPRHADPRRGGPDGVWRIKSQGNEEARQEFLDGYVPQILELGLEIPDPKLRTHDDGVWEYTEPDWDKLLAVVTGHGPASQERLALPRDLARRGATGSRARSCAEAA